MTAGRAAALASPTGHQQGPPVYLARVGGGRASERAARPRVDRGRARCSVLFVRRARRGGIRASDDQPHEPWGIYNPTISIPRTRSRSTIRTSVSAPSTCYACSTGSPRGTRPRPPRREGIRRAARHVRRAAVPPRGPGHIEECAELLRGDRGIQGLQLAAVGAARRRPDQLRPAGLLSTRMSRRGRT